MDILAHHKKQARSRKNTAEREQKEPHLNGEHGSNPEPASTDTSATSNSSDTCRLPKTASQAPALAAMCHEFRTPLNAIIGFSEIIHAQLYGPLGSTKYEEYARGIRTAGADMLVMLEDVIDIIKSGYREDLNEAMQVLSFSEVVSACVDNFHARCADKEITLLCDSDCDDGDHAINADPAAVGRALEQILSNAVKFTDPGGTISVVLSAATDSVSVTVTDTGRGIPDDRLADVMEAFSFAEQDPYHAHRGRGLGLAVAKSLLEQYGGALTLKSEVNVGTSITATLPRHKPET